MPAENRIVVEIVDSVSGGEKDGPSPEPEKEKKVQGTSSSAWQMATYAATQISSMIINEGEYVYGKYLSLTENYVAQNAVTQATSVINGFSSIVSSAASGAMFGGVPGAIIGAAIGTVKLGVQTFKNYADAYEELDQKAYDKYYYGARYGLINGNRGTDN